MKPLKGWKSELRNAEVRSLYVVDYRCIIAEPEDREHFRDAEGLLHRYDSWGLLEASGRDNEE